VFCEDSDWCLRRGGYRLGYAHDSVVRHIHGSTSGSSTDKKKVSPFNLYLTARNRVRLVRKQFGAAWPLSALLILIDLGRILVRGTWSGYRIALRGWWAGIKDLGGPPPALPKRI
jgi:GT2 family glycosyltransferase